MKPILDATAGNRTIYKHDPPQQTVFMDKEYGLAVPPDVFCVWKDLPFRDDVFETVIFDPPHYWGNLPPWFNKPGRGKNSDYNPNSKWPNSTPGWYGTFIDKRDMITSIMKAQKEFFRVANRVCLKWSEVKLSLWNILSLFRDWTIVNEWEYISPFKRGKQRTYWVTLVRPGPEASGRSMGPIDKQRKRT